MPNASVRVPSLPSFGRGERETQVVAVGSEYAAIYAQTGQVIGQRTYERMEDAALQALAASQKGKAA